MPNGAELFVTTLVQLGIDRIFTLVGDHLNEVLAVAKRQGIRIVDMRHESGVTHAADAWARITRKPALALVTGGPGHTNSITGIATAQLAGSPLIAVSGSRAGTMADRQAFQDIDQVAMTRPIVKWAAEPPTASLIPFYLGRAYSEANSGRKGAVHLTIPVDLFTGQTDVAARIPLPVEHAAPEPASACIEEAIAILQEAKRPVVIAGSGIWWSGAAEELREFVEKASLPLYTITMARGTVSDEHPLCMGYADPALNRAARQAFPEADVVLVIGKRIDFRLAFGGPRVFSPAAKFIQVDIHPQEFGLNRNVDLAICADAQAALRALTAAASRYHWSTESWRERLSSLRAGAEKQLAEAGSGADSPIHPGALFDQLKKLLPPETRYSWDGGDFAHWGRASIPARVNGGWLRLGPLGTIGSALPNAVALKLAHPDDPVVMITGDGALGFYIAELDTLVRYGLPVVIIVGNDAGWGLERELQSSASTDGETVACELRRTRYDIVMQGFGGGGETIDHLDQLRPALQRALSSRVPYLLNVNIAGVRSPFTEWNIAGRKR
jgi:acetolactate synthase-1/2/3 large subunit